MADRLFLSLALSLKETTVLQLESWTQAALYALRHGAVSLDGVEG